LALISACAAARSTPTPSPLPSLTTSPTSAPSFTPSPSPSPSPTSAPTFTPSPTAAVIDVQPADALAFFDAHRGLMVGTDAADGAGRGIVWRTGDGGRTWTRPVAVAPRPLQSITVVGTSLAWALQACPGAEPSCPSETVWASTDAGRTWRRAASVSAYALSFADPRQGWAVVGGPRVDQDSPGLFHTVDGGQSWRAASDPCRPSFGWAAAVSFADEEHGWIGCLGMSGAGETPKGIVATADGGRTWSLRSATFPGRPDVGSITISDDLAGLAMRPDGAGLAWGDRGLTMRTADGGRTWRSMPPGEWDVVDAGSGWATSDTAWMLLLWDGERGRQVVEATTNAGRSWVVMSEVSPVHSTG
jgi:photosystem II stability/assembly factor-like uncharacterized protein